MSGLSDVTESTREVGYLMADVIRGPYRRQCAHTLLCHLRVHTKITLWDTRGGYDRPPEYNWACEWCGHERLPYRSLLWSVPIIGRWLR